MLSKLPPLPANLPPLGSIPHIKSPSRSKTKRNVSTVKTNLPPLSIIVSDNSEQNYGFTGNKDVDTQIMQNLNDTDLAKVCSLNSYTRKLCLDENFWMNRTMARFGTIIPIDELVKFKNEFNTWKKYYLDLVNFLEYIYNNKTELNFETSGLYHTILTDRNDLKIIRDVVQQRTSEFQNILFRNKPEDVEKFLNKDFINPNRIFSEFSNQHVKSIDPKKKRDRILEIIFNDYRFKWLALYYSPHFYQFLPLLRKQQILEILYKRFMGFLFFEWKIVKLLKLAKEKGVTKNEFEKLYKNLDKNTDKNDMKELESFIRNIN